jgi:hypothetical protein
MAANIKYFNTLFGGIIAVLALVSCGNDDALIVDFGSVTVDRVVNISADKNAPACKIHLELKYAKESNGEKADIINDAIENRLFEIKGLPMKQAADSFANSYTANYKKSLAPLYKADKNDPDKQAWYQYHNVITTDVRPGHKGVAVYLITRDYYEGGAHGINQQLAMNFNTQTGQYLTLADILVPGYEIRLNEALLQALMDKMKAGNLDDLHEKGYLTMMDIFPPENFIFDEETLTFIYNPYEIAAYALGKTELTIPLSKIEDLLKKDM